MYLADMVTVRGEVACVAVASPRELFDILWAWDKSSHVIAWKIADGLSPRDFGWAPPEGWDKCRVGSYKQGDFT